MERRTLLRRVEGRRAEGRVVEAVKKKNHEGKREHGGHGTKKRKTVK